MNCVALHRLVIGQAITIKINVRVRLQLGCSGNKNEVTAGRSPSYRTPLGTVWERGADEASPPYSIPSPTCPSLHLNATNRSHSPEIPASFPPPSSLNIHLTQFHSFTPFNNKDIIDYRQGKQSKFAKKKLKKGFAFLTTKLV